MRTVGQVMGRMRRMAAEFQGQFMDAMREAEFDSVRKELAELNQKATASIADLEKIGQSFDPAAMIRDEVTRAAEPLAHLPAPAPSAAMSGLGVAIGEPPRVSRRRAATASRSRPSRRPHRRPQPAPSARRETSAAE